MLFLKVKPAAKSIIFIWKWTKMRHYYVKLIVKQIHSGCFSCCVNKCTVYDPNIGGFKVIINKIIKRMNKNCITFALYTHTHTISFYWTVMYRSFRSGTTPPNALLHLHMSPQFYKLFVPVYVPHPPSLFSFGPSEWKVEWHVLLAMNVKT